MQTTLKNHILHIDDEDAHLLTEHNWQVRVQRGKPNVYRTWQVNHKTHIQFLHHLLLPAQGGLYVYFRDGDTLNFTRANLYLDSKAQAVKRAAKARKGQTQYPCPYSPGRLRELHWNEQRTLNEIGVAAQQLEAWKRAPSPQIVKNWFQSANVPTRTQAEASALLVHQAKISGARLFSPDAKTKSRLAAKRRYQPLLLQGQIVVPARRGWNHTAASKRKMSLKRQGKGRAPDPAKSRAFTCPQCQVEFTRYISQITSDTLYCSRACAGRARRQQETRACSQCAIPVTRMSSRFTKPVQFCTLACANKYKWAHNPPAIDHTNLIAANRRNGQAHKAQRVTRFCAECSAPISRCEADFKTATPCCSRSCAQKFKMRQQKQKEGTP